MRQLQEEFENLKKSLDKDADPILTYQLGLFYEFGIGVGNNSCLAQKYYKDALNHGEKIQQRAQNAESTLAEFIWACILSKNTAVQYQKEAIYWFYRLAQKGYAPAQNFLGWMYQHGKGVEKNYEQAKYWYTLSANKEYILAQYNLGMLLQGRQGILKDYTQAVEWLTKAAKAGYAAAQHKLGTHYRKAQGVAKKNSEAAFWYFEASKQEYAPAQRRMGIMYRTGTGTTFNNDQGGLLFQQMYAYYREAAEMGDADAQYKLASLMRDGRMIGLSKLVKLNDKIALENYESSAGLGHAEAQNYLGLMYRDSLGLKKPDYNKAIEWLTLAANSGSPNAQNNLGAMYGEGKGVPQNAEIAFGWYLKAALQYYALGMNNIGIKYYNGTGVARDMARGIFW
ncbi:MAG: tetratricopeptide repeat protein, partial [Gammaproteobacteria bacterium]